MVPFVSKNILVSKISDKSEDFKGSSIFDFNALLLHLFIHLLRSENNTDSCKNPLAGILKSQMSGSNCWRRDQFFSGDCGGDTV